MADARHPALERIVSDDIGRAAYARLAHELPGTDLKSLLLGVFADRASKRTPTEILRQYRDDRFVAPAPLDALTIARVELAALEAAAPAFEPITLAPVMPLGTHSVLGSVPQNNVISTGRMTEVTADPTNSLALEAVGRRLDDASSTVRLAAVHRVVRAQQFSGPRSFAHFSLLGTVIAGRDIGNRTFEHQAAVQTLQVLVNALRSGGITSVKIQLTAFTVPFEPVCEAIAVELRESDDSLVCEIWPDREHGRGYYRNLCFKVFVTIRGEDYELGDGGDVDWTQTLLANKKERLLIGGLGLERLAMLASTAVR